ncbi:MAG: hypothetical protein WBV40_12555, partial [Candidatus Cybelea sp.]
LSSLESADRDSALPSHVAFIGGGYVAFQCDLVAHAAGIAATGRAGVNTGVPLVARASILSASSSSGTMSEPARAPGSLLALSPAGTLADGVLRARQKVAVGCLPCIRGV